jgi:exonuclease V
MSGNTEKKPFLKYRSDGLRVNELSQQLWCEKKVDLALKYGQKETLEMKKGKRRHEELLEEIIPITPVQPETCGDHLFVSLHQMLLMAQKIMKGGLGRELPVFGKIDTMAIRGYIDELVIKGGKLVIVEEKTTARGKLPGYWACRVVEFQLSLYKLMIDNIKEGHFTDSDLIAFYDIKPETSISETFLNSFPRRNVLATTNVSLMASMAFGAVRSLPETTDLLVARYENQRGGFIGRKKFIFDKEKLRRDIDFVLGYWKGSREAIPVLPRNRWKCASCHRDLKNKCDVHAGV